MTNLAAAVDELATSLRFAYGVGEIAVLPGAGDRAQAALDYAVGSEHGADIDRRTALVAQAQAALDLATPYEGQAADFRTGQLVHLDDERVRILRVVDTAIEVARGADGSIAVAHDAGTELVPASTTIEVLIDGSGADIEAGEKAPVLVPFAGRIDRVRMLADQAGSAVVDIVRSTFGDPPGSGTSITAAAKPELVAAANYDDAVLAGWTRELAADDVLVPVIEAASGIERLTLVLTVAL